MKKVISFSSILAILFSQAGCVGDHSSQTKSTEAEQTTQEEKKDSISNEKPRVITLTNKAIGQKIEIPLDEFQKMSRQEFAKKIGVSEEEANKLSDAEFERTKKAMIEWNQLMEENTNVDDTVGKVQDFKQHFQDVAEKGHMHIQEEIDISLEADKANDEK